MNAPYRQTRACATRGARGRAFNALEPDAIVREVLAVHRDFDGRVASLCKSGNLSGGESPPPTLVRDAKKRPRAFFLVACHTPCRTQFVCPWLG